MGYDLQIRQQFTLGADGDKAEVRRVFQVDERVYVEVAQTSDARESTIMRAVMNALDEHGIGVNNGSEAQNEGSREGRSQR